MYTYITRKSQTDDDYVQYHQNLIHIKNNKLSYIFTYRADRFYLPHYSNILPLLYFGNNIHNF